jgi:hypothetical protein
VAAALAIGGLLKPYPSGTPYTERRVRALMNRLVALSGRADMQVLLADGVEAFIGFQSELATLQADIQRDIGTLKKGIRKVKEGLPALKTLRELRWYARCLGDALAWQVLLFDRKAIGALNSGRKPPVSSRSDSSDDAVFVMGGHLLANQYGVPIVHDITNWLRHGDMTFLRFHEERALGWFFRTVEVKSSVTSFTQNDDGTASAQMLVDLYSSEPLELPEERQPKRRKARNETPDESGAGLARRKEDRRIRDQFKRLDKMVDRRDLEFDAVTIVDGIPNVVLSVDHRQVHHWPDLRHAIRTARSAGYAFFDLDGFIGYAVIYDNYRANPEFFKQSTVREDVQERLICDENGVRNRLTVQQIPMREVHDMVGAPVMRFFNYDIPKRAKADLIHGRLLIISMVNTGRLDMALADRGFAIEPEDSNLAQRHYPYTVDLEWSTGETVCLAIPDTAVQHHVQTAIHEFSGLDYVVDHVAAIRRVPEIISREDWLRGVEAGPISP